MDKLSTYRNLLKKELEKQCKLGYSDMPDVRYKLVEDGTSFLVLAVGWHERKFIHDLWFHAELINGKIWFFENATDYQIDKALEEQGVAKADIVVGWLKDSVNRALEVAA